MHCGGHFCFVFSGPNWISVFHTGMRAEGAGLGDTGGSLCLGQIGLWKPRVREEDPGEGSEQEGTEE